MAESGIAKMPGGGLTEIIGAGEKGIAVGKPFQEPIFLTDTHIAGTTHVADIETLVAKLSVGDMLQFMRDPLNEFDEMAIKLLTPSGDKIGYLPSKKNEIVSRLMDGGKAVYAEVTEIELAGTWYKISIRTYLDD